MTKIKKDGVTKTPGKQPQGATVKSIQSGSNEVLAVRDGVERSFTRQIWDHLPPGKDGYQEVSEAPKAAATKKPDDNGIGSEGAGGAGTETKLKPAEAKAAYNKVASEYKTLFGEAPAQNLTVEEIQGLMTAKKSEGAGGAGTEGK